MAATLLGGSQYSTLPANYVYPESARPKLSELAECDDIPVIDLSCEDRNLVLKQIKDACQEYGFFQVINHGVSKEAVEGIQRAAHEIFDLPVEEKMKLYSNDPSKAIRMATSFNVKMENYNNWRDYLRLQSYPLEKYSPEWPSNPPSFKDAVSKYSREVRELGLRLEEAISESLGLDKDCLKNILGEQGQSLNMALYPACPEPELTYGLPGHTDLSALTILLQDMVAGLQVLRGDKWLTVKPEADAFVVNIGDILQALSNDKYKSVMHRVVVNAEKDRFSIAAFFMPSETAHIRAPEALRSPGEPSVYRDFTYREYYGAFWNHKFRHAQHLEYFKN